MTKTTIVFDNAEISRTSTMCPFWLRVETTPTSVEIVELNAYSLPEAYRKALAAGYDVDTWVNRGGVEMSIPTGIDHMRRTALELGLIR
jgi:hypothetical protein